MSLPKQYKKSFIPVESDPDIFNTLMHELGVSPRLQFIDVYSIHDRPIKAPLKALILNIPDCEAYDCRDMGVAMSEEEKIVWMPQTIDNACGLVGVLHAVCNLEGGISTTSMLTRIMDSRPEEMAAKLDSSEDVVKAYNLVADAGSTEIPADSDSVNHHYVCFVKTRQGTLFELDGEAQGPICHGSEELDVWDHGIAKIKERYIRDNEGLAFSLLALYESEDP